MSAAVTTAPSTESSSGRWLSLVAVILGTFVAVLNQSLINIAIPKLTTDLINSIPYTMGINRLYAGVRCYHSD